MKSKFKRSVMLDLCSKILICVCFLGVVDQIHGQSVLVELSNSGKPTQNIDIPIFMFPCDVREGDHFYVQTSAGVTEIRCGEPPE